MSLKDLNIFFYPNTKEDLATVSKAAFTNQQIRQCTLSKQGDQRFTLTISPIDDLKFNKNSGREVYVLNKLASLVKTSTKGIRSIEFSLDKSDIFNRNLTIKATYTTTGFDTATQSDTNNLTTSTFSFKVPT
jgi:hypothetical protein